MQLEKYALSRLVGIYKANVWNTNHLMHSTVQTFKIRKVFVKKKNMTIFMQAIQIHYYLYT